MRGLAWMHMLIVGGLSLSGCARDSLVTAIGETRSGEWYIAHQPDRVSGRELPSATVFAQASNSNFNFPRVSSVQLTCFEGKPLIRFAFDFKIGSNHNTALAYRFDDKPGHEDVLSRVVRGNHIIVIEDKDAIDTFVAELAGSKALFVRIRSINGGRSAVEYLLDGSAPAIRAAFAGCETPAMPLPEQRQPILSGVY